MAALPTSKIHHAGISNFGPAQLSNLLSKTDTTPFAHQMELHPYLPQNLWLDYHRARNIHVTAYSPLANMNPTYGPSTAPTPLLQRDEVHHIADKRGCTPAQVALAWGMGRGTSVIPKSSHESRIKENFGSKECVLEFDDLVTLQGLERKRFNNPSSGWGVPLYEGLEDA